MLPCGTYDEIFLHSVAAGSLIGAPLPFFVPSKDGRRCCVFLEPGKDEVLTGSPVTLFILVWV